MTATTKKHTPSTLRQRRSRSPTPKVLHLAENGGETESLIGEVGSSSKPKGLPLSMPMPMSMNGNTGNGVHDPYIAPIGLDYKEKLTTSSRQTTATLMMKGIALFIFTIPLAIFLGYWFVVYFGIYDTDPTCPVRAFDDPPWCANSFLHDRQLPPPLTSEEWLDWRRKYQNALTQAGVETRSSFVDNWESPNTVGFTLAFPDQLEIRNSLEKGRGIFATSPIPKGTKVWDSRYRAVFPTECSARIFFSQLSHQQKCDSIFWGYENDFYGNGIQYMIDLDGHGYINHAPGPSANAMHHFEGELEKERYRVSLFSWVGRPFRAHLPQDQWIARNTPGAYGLYATRDIAAGEEIFYDYDEIFMYGLIDWFTVYLQHSLPMLEWFTL